MERLYGKTYGKTYGKAANVKRRLIWKYTPYEKDLNQKGTDSYSFAEFFKTAV